MTGLQLAAIADCSNVTISRLENGHQQPTSSLAGRLAEALEVPLENLYFDPRRPPAVSQLAAALGLGGAAGARAPGPADDAEIERLAIDALRAMDPLLRAKAVGYILGLASGSSTFGAGAASKLAESAERTRRQAPPADRQEQ